MRSLITLTQGPISAFLSVSLLHVCLGLALTLLQAAEASASIADGEKIFSEICTACHTIGKGKLLGPDLAGVTTRREEAWLTRQITEPDRMIAETDPIVMQLLKESNNVPMVPLGVTKADAQAIIAYLKSTEQQASAETSLPSEYVPTLLISLVVLIGLTLTGLLAGSKKVDVR